MEENEAVGKVFFSAHSIKTPALTSLPSLLSEQSGRLPLNPLVASIQSSKAILCSLHQGIVIAQDGACHTKNASLYLLLGQG